MGSNSIYSMAAKARIPITWFFAMVIGTIIIVSHHSWPSNNWIDILIEFTGFIMIGICTLGRIWTSMYISGYKTAELIEYGPYSIVRNPLYSFSFIGAVGIGLASENLLALILLIVMFICYYPLVVIAEEEKLTKRHGDEFHEYTKMTPRFIPRTFKVKGPDRYVVNVKIFSHSLFDAMWFLWFFMILQIIERLHQKGAVPILFRFP